MSGYIFIANSTKPTKEKAASRDPIALSNVNRPCLQAALGLGYEVFLGVNRNSPEELPCELPVRLFDSHTYRSITAFRDNLTAYKNLCRVFRENDIQAIHCNTPVGGMIGRLCAKKFRAKKVIYTAHGFHFYKGAPLFNRTVLKFAERVMARWTDTIITMNQEDYEAAQQFKLRKGGKVYLVHGVGISCKDFEGLSASRQQKRKALNLADTDIALISMGDLIPRKNYTTAIQAIAMTQNPHLHYFICGKGQELDNLQRLTSELGIEKQVHFLGFRTDIKELLAAADIFLFTTHQEGLPRSMMEAMATGLPCVVSSIRGNVDLMEQGKGGFLCPSNDPSGFADAINQIAGDVSLREQMGACNLQRIQDYDIRVVEQEIQNIYAEVLG